MIATLRLWLALAAITAAVGAAALAYRHGYATGAEHTQAAWDKQKADMLIEQRSKEQSLQSEMDKLRENKNRAITHLSNTVRALSDSLRRRPERPSSAVTGAGDGAPGCTGAQLYRSDSEFLVRLGERADRLRIALKECQQAYQNAAQP